MDTPESSTVVAEPSSPALEAHHARNPVPVTVPAHPRRRRLLWIVGGVVVLFIVLAGTTGSSNR